MNRVERPPRSALIERFESACRLNGIAVTVQRRSVYEALAGRLDHPTADQLYAEVRDRVPGISRTTVYRVLETLVRIGMATVAPDVGSAVRYDPNTERHHHIHCKVCGRIDDLQDSTLDSLPMPDLGESGFSVHDFSVQVSGICGGCSSETGGGDREMT